MPSLRPLGIGETLDVAIKIYMRNAGTLFRLVLFVVAPINLLSIAVQASSTSSNTLVYDESGGTYTLGSDWWTSLAATLVAVLLTLVATTLASAACFKAVADAYIGQVSTWTHSLGYAARRLRSIVWVTILGWIFSILGAILLILPGIYLWICYVVAVPVLLTEGLRGRHALKRSRQLVRGRWWKVFTVVLLGTLLTSIISGVFTGIGSGVIFAGKDVNTVSGFVVAFLTQTVANTLTLPFTAAFVTVVYFDLRVRKEAFDLQLLAQQIGVQPSGGPDGGPAPLAPLPAPPPGSQPPYWPPPPGWTPADPPSPS